VLAIALCVCVRLSPFDKMPLLRMLTILATRIYVQLSVDECQYFADSRHVGSTQRFSGLELGVEMERE